jgi:vacuolar-type H+-ATPase subunit I/STV1
MLSLSFVVVGLLTLVISILFLLGGLVKPGFVFRWEEEPDSRSRYDVLKYSSTALLSGLLMLILSAVFRGENQRYFSENKNEVIERVDSLIKEDKPYAAIDTIEKYPYVGSVKLDSLRKIARSDTLHIMASRKNISLEEKVDVYQKIKKLNPVNKEYKKYLHKYKERKEEMEKKKARLEVFGAGEELNIGEDVSTDVLYAIQEKNERRSWRLECYRCKVCWR